MRCLAMALLAAASLATGGEASAQSTPILNWTGFYVGPNIGYSWGRSETTLSFVDGGTGATLSSGTSSFDMDGPLGGAQIGYNWQTGNWIIGWETDFQFTGQDGATGGACAGGSSPDALVNGVCTPGHLGDTDPFNVGAFPVVMALSQKLDWFGTLRGRFGASVTPTFIVYATGGLAYGRIETGSTVSGTNIFGINGTNTSTLVPVFASFNDAETRFGWTLGTGIEGQVIGNWSVKIEYLHIDLGTVSGSFVTPIITNSGAFLVSAYSSRITDDIVRLGLNYRFGP